MKNVGVNKHSDLKLVGVKKQTDMKLIGQKNSAYINMLQSFIHPYNCLVRVMEI